MNDYLCTVCAEDIAVAEMTATVPVANLIGGPFPMRIADLCGDCWDTLSTCIDHIKNGRYTVTAKQIILGTPALEANE